MHGLFACRFLWTWIKREPMHGCRALGSNCPQMQLCIGSACNISCADREVKILGMWGISRPDARGRRVSAFGPSNFALSDKGKRGISRYGATFFARGGKEGKTPLEPAVQDSLYYEMPSNSKVKQKMNDFVADGSVCFLYRCRSCFPCRSKRTNLPKKRLNQFVQTLLWQVSAGYSFKRQISGSGLGGRVNSSLLDPLSIPKRSTTVHPSMSVWRGSRGEGPRAALWLLCR